mgnify:CR=1 FL=1|tara:strand:- start:375 stop:677 length:303 start_codon:yes stop_codon:yes gene_type:complete
MKINTMSIFLNDIAIVWENKSSGYIDLKKLRVSCPCAFCSGEKDVFGTVYKGKRALSDSSFRLSRYEKVGLYGIRFFWEDHHHDGIYTYDLLKKLTIEEK